MKTKPFSVDFVIAVINLELFSIFADFVYSCLRYLQ